MQIGRFDLMNLVKYIFVMVKERVKMIDVDCFDSRMFEMLYNNQSSATRSLRIRKFSNVKLMVKIHKAQDSHDVCAV